MKIPNDEELLSFIEELEKEPLYVPPFLKETILTRIDDLNLPSSRPVPKWWQGNFSYNLKAIAGMAAAIILIFILPLDMNLYEWQEQVHDKRIEAAINRLENEELESESELDRLFRIGSSAINDTNMKIIDTLNIFSNLFEKEQ